MAITMPPFLLPATTWCNFWGFPLLSWPKQAFIFLVVFLSDFNSLSLAPSLLPIPVVLRNLSNSAAAFSSPSKFANHLLSTWGCHMTPSFSSSRTSFFLFFLHSWHRHTNAQLFALQFRPALGGFVNAYSGQECSYCPVSYFELVKLWGVLLRGNSKYQCYYTETG